MENTLFQDTIIHVTNTRIVTSDRTLYLNNITSVRIDTRSIWPIWPTISIVIGIVILFITGFTAWHVAMMFIGVGGFANFYTSNEYTIIVESNVGAIPIITSKDHSYISNLRNKIDEAIVSRK